MVDYIPTEKGTTIRQPSTANLMIDSNDRDETVYPSPFNFTINKPVSILNGYFTRLAVTEFSLDWYLPNINFADGANGLLSRLVLDISGTSYNVDIPNGFYNVYQLAQALNAVGTDVSGVVFTFAQIADTATAQLVLAATVAGATRTVRITGGGISTLLAYAALGTATLILGADLRVYKYIDVVSPQLTYAQDVKDTSTNEYDRNVLIRWYFEYENTNTYDTYGFPILPGYAPFAIKRAFNPPKQIRWEPNLPLGQVSFEIYSDQSTEPLLPGGTNFNRFAMTIQVSEV